MRAIKFRAWHKERKKMYRFGEFIYCDEYNHIGFKLNPEDREPNGGGYSNLDIYDDSELEIMQSTGLFDKNGKEIYEGDIVQISTWVDSSKEGFEDIWVCPSFHEVVWGGSYPAFDLKPPIDCDSNSLQLYADIQPNGERIEVIGNIYQSPEILKGP